MVGLFLPIKKKIKKGQKLAGPDTPTPLDHVSHKSPTFTILPLITLVRNKLDKLSPIPPFHKK